MSHHTKIGHNDSFGRGCCFHESKSPKLFRINRVIHTKIGHNDPLRGGFCFFESKSFQFFKINLALHTKIGHNDSLRFCATSVWEPVVRRSAV
jgi:hypothetical protein